MRFLWTIGPLTVFDFTLFHIDTNVIESDDVVVVHHYHDSESEEDGEQGGPDLFGGKQ